DPAEDVDHVRQIAARHQRGELGAVVGDRDHVEVELRAELAVDFLPRGVLVERGGGGLERLGERGNRAARAGGLADAGGPMGGVVVVAIFVERAGAGEVGRGAIGDGLVRGNPAAGGAGRRGGAAGVRAAGAGWGGGGRGLAARGEQQGSGAGRGEAG